MNPEYLHPTEADGGICLFCRLEASLHSGVWFCDCRKPYIRQEVTCEGFGNPLGTFTECPHCGAALTPEHAHFKCTSCGWRDSCCD